MISFIIPVHNESEYIAGCVEHLRGLGDSHNFEIIVVLSSETDDGSESILKSINTFYIRSCATSRSIQMNEGAERAQGSFFCFVHADVRLPITALTDIKASIDNGYKAGLFSYRFDRPHFLLHINASFTRRKGVLTGGGDQSLFILNSVFKELGGFDPSCVIMEDFNLFDRIKRSKIPYDLVQNEAIVSARKYDKHSYFRINAVNALIFSLYKAGIPYSTLKSLLNHLL